MSSSKGSATPNQPHIALYPSAGIGHLTPFLRLASILLSHNCEVTLITAKPTVSLSESMNISSFLSTNPEVKHVEFQVLPSEPHNSTDDPFFLQFEAARRSMHLLRPLLSDLSPPLSAIFSDFVVASGVNQIAADLGLPQYILITTSATFFSLMAYLPNMIHDPAKFSSLLAEVEIPGLTPVPVSSIPPPMFTPNHLFTSTILTNIRAFQEVKGILMNTFDWFEPEAISFLNNCKALGSFPPVLPIGPLVPHELGGEQSQYLEWLDNQPTESVVYVSFGSRTSISKEQMIELGDALDRSEYRFLWVIKGRKVDYDDKESLEDLVSHSFLERTKNKGMVVKGWVKQQGILAHPAIGGFVSHCGWNSVTEAAQQGIPVLAWPLHGDQRVNADVVEKAGLGTSERSWGWMGQTLVKQDEIQRKIDELMRDEKLRSRAKKVGEEAKKAGNTGGSSKKVIMEVIEFLKQNMTN
ncbi:hypothetical protein SLA2020_106300 [Shorea laevis]